jgi:hypothetical protein
MAKMPIAERIAEVPWRIQKLPDEDAFDHRVRVAREILTAAADNHISSQVLELREELAAEKARVRRLENSLADYKLLAERNADEVKAWRERDPLKTERELDEAQQELKKLRKGMAGGCEQHGCQWPKGLGKMIRDRKDLRNMLYEVVQVMQAEIPKPKQDQIYKLIDRTRIDDFLPTNEISNEIRHNQWEEMTPKGKSVPTQVTVHPDIVTIGSEDGRTHMKIFVREDGIDIRITDTQFIVNRRDISVIYNQLIGKTSNHLLLWKGNLEDYSTKK